MDSQEPSRVREMRLCLLHWHAGSDVTRELRADDQGPLEGSGVVGTESTVACNQNLDFSPQTKDRDADLGEGDGSNDEQWSEFKSKMTGKS